MTTTTLTASQIDVAGVATALIDTGTPAGSRRASGRPPCCCCTDRGRG